MFVIWLVVSFTITVMLSVLIFALTNTLPLANSARFRQEAEYREVTGLRVKKIKGKGRGVVTTKKITKGDIVEVCPLVVDETTLEGELANYVFSDEKRPNASILPFGYCGMYNDANVPNMTWEIKDDKMICKAIRDIDEGEELTHSYGDEYWHGKNKV